MAKRSWRRSSRLRGRGGRARRSGTCSSCAARPTASSWSSSVGSFRVFLRGIASCTRAGPPRSRPIGRASESWGSGWACEGSSPAAVGMTASRGSGPLGNSSSSWRGSGRELELEHRLRCLGRRFGLAGRAQAVLLDEGTKLVVEIVELGEIVRRVLIRGRLIPGHGQLGGLVDLDARARAGDVVRDLVTGLIRALRAEGELVRRGGIPLALANLVLIARGRFLERLRLHEVADGHAMSLEIPLPPLMENRNVRRLAPQEQAEHLLHPPSLEELDATRAQARALDEELAARIQEHGVLHLVGE